VSRKATIAMREEELIFIGMAPPDPLHPDADPRLAEAAVKRRRKLLQAEHEQAYR